MLSFRNNIATNERNIILASVPNTNTRECFDSRMRKKFSPRFRARACGKSYTVETLEIYKQKLQCFTQSKQNLSSLSMSLFSFFIIVMSIPFRNTISPSRQLNIEAAKRHTGRSKKAPSHDPSTFLDCVA